MRRRSRAHRLSHGLLLSTCLAAQGCGSEDAPGAGAGSDPPDFDYPLDDVLRLNHLQAKGTHNSYHLLNPDLKGSELDYTHAPLDVQLRSQGVRKLELDIQYDAAEDRILVFHIRFLDEGTTCRAFTECLSVLKTWSDENRAHHPIFVQIEPKDIPDEGAAEQYFGRLEDEVLSAWPRERIVTPDDVRKGAATLREAVTTGGWPTLGEARGKILFFIDNHADFRRLYTHGEKDLDGRLMFADAEPDQPWAGVLLANDPLLDAQKIADSVAAGFIVRTRADADPREAAAGDTTRRDAALASGAHLISTDFPAPVDGIDYVVDIPGGTPSRCNPVTAPAECTSEAVEDPGLLETPGSQDSAGR